VSRTMPEILKEGPIRRWLKERKTLVPRKKLVNLLGKNPNLKIEGLLIKERIPVPGPEVERYYV